MSAVSAVKKRMGEMRDGIDEAENNMKEFEQLKRDADSRGLTAEGEVSSLKNRVFQLQEEIDKVKKRLEEQQAKLDAAEGRTVENDDVRKDLEGRETDNDQDLVMLEQSTKDIKVLVTENTQKYDDALNKFKVLEGDLERVYERLTTAQNKVDRLEDEAKQVNTDLKDLETRDEEASQREMSLEDQVRYLDVQLKETDQRADQLEREVAKLERLRDTTNGSIELEKKKTETIKSELEATMNDLMDVSHGESLVEQRSEPQAEENEPQADEDEPQE